MYVCELLLYAEVKKQLDYRHLHITMSDAESYDDGEYYDDTEEPVRVLTEDEGASSAAEEVRQVFARPPTVGRGNSSSADITSDSKWQKPLMTRIDIIRITDPDGRHVQRLRDNETANSDEVFLLPGGIISRPRSLAETGTMSQSYDSGFYKVSSDAEASEQVNNKRLFEVTDHDVTRQTFFFRPDTTLSFDENERPPSFSLNNKPTTTRSAVNTPHDRNDVLSNRNTSGKIKPRDLRDISRSVDASLQTPKYRSSRTSIEPAEDLLSTPDGNANANQSNHNSSGSDSDEKNDAKLRSQIYPNEENELNDNMLDDINSDNEENFNSPGDSPLKLNSDQTKGPYIFPELSTRAKNDMPKIDLADKGQSMPILVPTDYGRKPFTSERDGSIIDNTRTPSEFSAGILHTIPPSPTTNNKPRALNSSLPPERFNNCNDLTFGPLPDELLRPSSKLTVRQVEPEISKQKNRREFWTQTIGQMYMKAATRNTETQTSAKSDQNLPTTSAFTQTSDNVNGSKLLNKGSAQDKKLIDKSKPIVNKDTNIITTENKKLNAKEDKNKPFHKKDPYIDSDASVDNGKREIMKLLLSQVRSIRNNLDPDTAEKDSPTRNKRKTKHRKRSVKPPAEELTTDDEQQELFTRRMQLFDKEQKPNGNKLLKTPEQENEKQRKSKPKSSTRPENKVDSNKRIEPRTESSAQRAQNLPKDKLYSPHSQHDKEELKQQPKLSSFPENSAKPSVQRESDTELPPNRVYTPQSQHESQYSNFNRSFTPQQQPMDYYPNYDPPMQQQTHFPTHQSFPANLQSQSNSYPPYFAPQTQPSIYQQAVPQTVLPNNDYSNYPMQNSNSFLSPQNPQYPQLSALPSLQAPPLNPSLQAPPLNPSLQAPPLNPSMIIIPLIRTDSNNAIIPCVMMPPSQSSQKTGKGDKKKHQKLRCIGEVPIGLNRAMSASDQMRQLTSNLAQNNSIAHF